MGCTHFLQALTTIKVAYLVSTEIIPCNPERACPKWFADMISYRVVLPTCIVFLIATFSCTATVGVFGYVYYKDREFKAPWLIGCAVPHLLVSFFAQRLVDVVDQSSISDNGICVPHVKYVPWNYNFGIWNH